MASSAVATTTRPTYLERIADVQAEINSGERNRAGLTAEGIVRKQIKNEVDGVAFSGLNVARRNAAIMKHDREIFDQDRSKPTVSLGGVQGLVVQHYMIAAKKAGKINQVYWYLSGWDVAAQKSEDSPQPDVSGHDGSAVVHAIQEGYKFMLQADAVEKQSIFDAMDAAQKSGDEAAYLAEVAKIDNFESHVRPIIADIDAGFGDPAKAKMLAVRMIEAGACCIQIENQDSQSKQCGHQDGKVTVPHEEYIPKIRAVNQAFIECDVDGSVVARTDSVDGRFSKDIAPQGSPWATDYNRFLELNPVTDENPLRDNDVMLVRDGETVRLMRSDNGLFSFHEGTGHARAVMDAVRAITEGGAHSVWIETSEADLTQITSLYNDIVEGVRDRVSELTDLAEKARTDGRHDDAVAMTAQVQDILSRPVNLTYNNSPSFPWTVKARQRILKAWKAEGKDISMYPDVEDKKALQSPTLDDTPLGEAERAYIQEFRRNGSEQAGISHHLVTLSGWHLMALNAQLLMQGYLSDEAMLAYVRLVQNMEFNNGISSVLHQKTAGSGLKDQDKKDAIGDHANIAAGKGQTEQEMAAAFGAAGSAAAAATAKPIRSSTGPTPAGAVSAPQVQ